MYNATLWLSSAAESRRRERARSGRVEKQKPKSRLLQTADAVPVAVSAARRLCLQPPTRELCHFNNAHLIPFPLARHRGS